MLVDDPSVIVIVDASVDATNCLVTFLKRLMALAFSCHTDRSTKLSSRVYLQLDANIFIHASGLTDSKKNNMESKS